MKYLKYSGRLKFIKYVHEGNTNLKTAITKIRWNKNITKDNINKKGNKDKNNKDKIITKVTNDWFLYCTVLIYVKKLSEVKGLHIYKISNVYQKQDKQL